MPVSKRFKAHYGKVWKTLIRPQILERAGRCCERCGKPDRVLVTTAPGGYWFDERMGKWRGPGHAIALVGVPPELRGQVMLWPQFELALQEMESDLDGKRPLLKDVLVVICACHLNHIAGDDRDENLAAWCQHCHLQHDLMQHHWSRAARKDATRPLLCQIDDGLGGGPPSVLDLRL